MERKSLGRALEDISNLFLSSAGRPDERPVDTGFWSIGIREETCASCAHFVESPDKTPKCKIFSFENERYGVPHLGTITYGHGRYCKYYTKAKEGLSEEPSASTPAVPAKTQDDFELEEAITVSRKMAYPDSESGQKNMQEVILQYIREGYDIRWAELRRRVRVHEPGRRETRDEDLTVFIKQNGAS